MARYTFPSIEEAGGIVGFLNKPEQRRKYPHLSGTEFERVMQDHRFSDKVKRRMIYELSGVRSWSTVKSWIALYNKEHSV